MSLNCKSDWITRTWNPFLVLMLEKKSSEKAVSTLRRGGLCMEDN